MFDKDDEHLANQFIYLPLVRKVLERDLHFLRDAKLKFNEPYIEFVEQVIIQIGKDLGRVKKEMFQRRLSVYNQGKVGELSVYLFVCKGYRREVRLFPHLMKQSVEEYVRKYFKVMKRNA
jgi:hypothetical protein